MAVIISKIQKNIQPIPSGGQERSVFTGQVHGAKVDAIFGI